MKINGKEVKDATKHLDLHIQDDDCKKGKTKDPGACAAARAILREQPGVIGARVHRGVTYLEYEKNWVRYLTPESLKTELTVFDRGAKFEPGIHTLSAPTHTAKSLTERRKQRADNRQRNHKRKGPKRPRHEIPNIRPRGANR